MPLLCLLLRRALGGRGLRCWLLLVLLLCGTLGMAAQRGGHSPAQLAPRQAQSARAGQAPPDSGACGGSTPARPAGPFDDGPASQAAANAQPYSPGRPQPASNSLDGQAQLAPEPAGPASAAPQPPWFVTLQMVGGTIAAASTVALLVLANHPLMLLLSGAVLLAAMMLLGLVSGRMEDYNAGRARGEAAQRKMERGRRRAHWLQQFFQLNSLAGGALALLALILRLLGISTGGAPGAGLRVLIGLAGLAMLLNFLALLAAWGNALWLYHVRYRSLRD